MVLDIQQLTAATSLGIRHVLCLCASADNIHFDCEQFAVLPKFSAAMHNAGNV